MVDAGHQPSIVTYTQMMSACGGHTRSPARAEELFAQMLEGGVEPNRKALTNLQRAVGPARLEELCDELGVRIPWPRHHHRSIPEALRERLTRPSTNQERQAAR